MSEHAVTSVASVIRRPKGEITVHRDALTRSLRAKGMGFVAMGMANRFQEEKVVDETGIAIVNMNSSGRLGLEAGKDGLIATTSLAGCTGVAGFAKRSDGSTLQFISHYDTMSQNARITGKDSPINRDLYSFRYQATKTGGLSGPILYLVAYDEGEHANPDYGTRRGTFKDWRYLDQIQVTATQLGQDAEVLLLPYSLNQEGHNLAAGRVDEVEGIFWDGVQVDFNNYLNKTVQPNAIAPLYPSNISI